MQQKQFFSSFDIFPLEEVIRLKTGVQSLSIGLPKETVFQENRVALTPDAISVLVHKGHRVTVERNAGLAAHFKDYDYVEAGAVIADDKETVYKCPIIIKSAPIVEDDLNLLQQNQTIIHPIHFSLLSQSILKKLMQKQITGLRIESLKDNHGNYSVLRSLSQIAGSASILIAAEHLSSHHGKGVLLGGVSGIAPTKIIIIGAGIVGEFALRSALALGASVKVFDDDVHRLQRLEQSVGRRIWTSVIEPRLLAKQLKSCEVAIGALSSHYGRAPVVVSEEMVANMRRGSVIIDVAIDRGGCFETSEMTTHQNPTFVKHDVIHYCVPNITSGYARTASQAISNALTPLLIQTGDAGGFDMMIRDQEYIRESVYMFKGNLIDQYFGERFNIRVSNIMMLLSTLF
ncbi:MAG: alanine dehydrogenase [Phycisphaerales bacterium]|nr:alanine dehydrogenase [Phycisphaerales bacterium]